MASAAVVLSGGGARGAAHLGVLAALEELKIKISAISGVSAGAIAGALYAAGLSPLAILNVLKSQSYFGISNIAWLKDGIFSMEKLKKTLAELIKTDDFGNLKIRLFINATDISTGLPVSFSEGILYDIIIASASVPIIFEPVIYGNYQLLDGGILDNLPVDPLVGKYDLIIGSHVNKLWDNSSSSKLNKISLLDRCFHIAINGHVKNQSQKCQVFIEPMLEGFGMFDMKNADKLFEIGYKATMEQKEKILGLYQ